MPSEKIKYKDHPVIKRSFAFKDVHEEKLAERLIAGFDSYDYKFYGKYQKMYALAEYYLTKDKGKLVRAYSILSTLYSHSWYLNLDIYQRVSRRLYHIYSGKFPSLIDNKSMKIEINLPAAKAYLFHAAKELFKKGITDFEKVEYYFYHSILKYTLEELQIFFDAKIVFETEQNFNFFQAIFNSTRYPVDEITKNKLQEVYSRCLTHDDIPTYYSKESNIFSPLR